MFIYFYIGYNVIIICWMLYSLFGLFIFGKSCINLNVINYELKL